MTIETQSAAAPALPGMIPGPVPAHVPAELVRMIDYESANTLDDPFSPTAGVHADLPPVFYWAKNRPGRYDGTWVVTHYEDIREVYQRDDLYSTATAGNHQVLAGETFINIPQQLDPPEHTKYRMLLNPWFSPKAITALEPKIRGAVDGLIDGFVDRGGCDAAYDFGRIYPVQVFLDMMGFPFSMMDEFLQWEYAILHSQYDVERMKWGVVGVLAYLRQEVEAIRRRPSDNLASFIVHARIDDRPVSDDEIIGMLFFLWRAGLDTVAATTALILRRLALQPAVQQQLRADPGLIPDAIEEFLRVQPLVNSSRLVRQDHEIRGVRIKKGDHVLCYNLAGNFDAAEIEAPRELRFDRPVNRHFTLGGGPHRCLGSHLARRELRIAIGEFLRRVPPFTLAPDADRTVFPNLIATTRLPIVWS